MVDSNEVREMEAVRDPSRGQLEKGVQEDPL
jgi:hypothetical protein